MVEPTILLKHAELLHVAIATIVNILDTRTDYPVDNIEGVISAYRYGRDKHLKEKGYTTAQIHAFTDAAADALVSWLDERETRKAESRADFDQWAQEFREE